MEVNMIGLPAAIGLSAGVNLANTAANFYWQKKNYDYQKNLQNQIFYREDNSVQRRVADLKAAGLSPVLAAGAGADAGPVVSTKAPQLDGLGDLSSAIQMTQMENYQKQMEATDADISKTRAEEKYINQQRQKIALEAEQQWMDNEYQRKAGGMPANVSPVGKVIRDVQPLMNNFKKTLERVAPVEDAYKVPFGSYKYGK